VKLCLVNFRHVKYFRNQKFGCLCHGPFYYQVIILFCYTSFRPIRTRISSFALRYIFSCYSVTLFPAIPLHFFLLCSPSLCFLLHSVFSSILFPPSLCFLLRHFQTSRFLVAHVHPVSICMLIEFCTKPLFHLNPTSSLNPQPVARTSSNFNAFHKIHYSTVLNG
jgi:hypothetical protein